MENPLMETGLGSEDNIISVATGRDGIFRAGGFFVESLFLLFFSLPASSIMETGCSPNDRNKIVCPFLLALGLQDRWQPIREDQLAMRTNDCWLLGETGLKSVRPMIGLLYHELYCVMFVLHR